ncbi:hypothetical protein [Teredinibacter turnerae]|uniref:hypothetical protein n=1 Tax=Teredinibacter turnerae TaxID=2426 RepID=UPI0005F89354|nr:hypothetical protein [Teredinibacter turnerae]
MLKKGVLVFVAIFIILAGYVVYKINYCRLYLRGVDSKEFNYVDGVAYLKGDSTPYSGVAYSTVCGGECGIWCASLHWRAEFKDGRYHGNFDAPLAGVSDGNWFSPGDKTDTYVYQNGVRIK